jgi:hypothetical protein
MKLGTTLGLVGDGVVTVLVDCLIGDDLPSSEIRRRLLIGDGIVCFGGLWGRRFAKWSRVRQSIFGLVMHLPCRVYTDNFNINQETTDLVM